MTVVHVSVVIDAPPHDVWAVVSDPRNLPHWDRHIETIEGFPSDGLSPGARYATVIRFMGIRAREEAEVLEWSPPTHATILITGIIDARIDSMVTALPGKRSLLEHEVDYTFRGGTLGKLAARSLRMVGGARIALHHGTMAQAREIEARRRAP